jgi:hypothetical protein
MAEATGGRHGTSPERSAKLWSQPFPVAIPLPGTLRTVRWSTAHDAVMSYPPHGILAWLCGSALLRRFCLAGMPRLSHLLMLKHGLHLSAPTDELAATLLPGRSCCLFG